MRPLLALLAVLILTSCRSAEKASPPDAMSLPLDVRRSSLSAVTIKNESVPVTLRFPSLEGHLSLKPLKAVVSAALDRLETGDTARDANIKEYFFEVEKAPENKQAIFELTQLEGDPTLLKEGESLPMKARGSLRLHGVKAELSGPLIITRLKGGAFSAAFKETWSINIKEVNMLEVLANLNAVCPQPHRVGHQVKLSGELVFAKP